MSFILTILYSLYFGLVPFDNLKDLSGDTITKKIGIIIIIFLLVDFLLKKRKKLKINFFNTYVLIIFLIYSLSYFFIFKAQDSIYTRFCFLFIIFILSTQLDLKKEKLKRIFDFSIIISAAIALNSILLNLDFSYIDRTHYYIWNNMTVDANIYCSTLIFPLLYCLNNLLDKNNKSKLFYIILLSLHVISAFVSGSRGGLLAIALGIICLILFDNNRSKAKNKILFIIILIALAYFIIPYLPENIVDRLSLSAVVEDKASNRFEIWNYAINRFKSGNVFNMFFGYGFLSFRTLSNLDAVSHNLFIQTLLEGGFFMIIILTIFFYKTLKCFKSKNSNFMLSYTISVLIMSCSLDVIASRFLWNYFIIAFFYINYLNKEKSIDNKKEENIN